MLFFYETSMVRVLNVKKYSDIRRRKILGNRLHRTAISGYCDCSICEPTLVNNNYKYICACVCVCARGGGF